MKHHCRAFRVSPATRLGHFAGKIGNWIALQGAFGRSSLGPKLFDAATGSNSRGPKPPYNSSIPFDIGPLPTYN